jgi:hypothetical protein
MTFRASRPTASSTGACQRAMWSLRSSRPQVAWPARRGCAWRQRAAGHRQEPGQAPDGALAPLEVWVRSSKAQTSSILERQAEAGHGEDDAAVHHGFRSAAAMGGGCLSHDPSGAALGPRTTGKPQTTAASDGQPTAQVSDRF